MDKRKGKRRGPYAKKKTKLHDNEQAGDVSPRAEISAIHNTETVTYIIDSTIDHDIAERLVTPSGIEVNTEQVTYAAVAGNSDDTYDDPEHFPTTSTSNSPINMINSAITDEIGDKASSLLGKEPQDFTTTEEKENFFNETFGEQFDDIMQTLHEDAKHRDGDLLADETETNVLFDIASTSHLGSVVMDDVSVTLESRDTPDDEQSDQSNRPVFENSPHSLGVVVLLICCFMIRFRLPDEALSYLIQILACILPHGHRLMGSLYHFRKFIKKFTHEVLPTITYHCNSCYEIVEKRTKECPACRKSLIQSGAVAYFLQLRLISQLESLWKNADFCDIVRTHRFEHMRQNKDRNLRDIYDGTLYQSLYNNNGILSEENNLSFSMNTDGAPLFKSSSVSIWPVYLLINELPIAKRKKRNFSLFYGVWIASKKPQMWSFLKPLFSELAALESNGHQFTDYLGNQFNSKCTLITCTCDLPARAIVYNCNQFNGEYSCWFCLEKGETFKHDTGGISHIYPYNEDCPKGNKRTAESVAEDVNAAVEKIKNKSTKYTVHGHKGKFWFMFLNHFDVINSCVIDYMHGVCLGVTKQLLTLWFDKKNNTEVFSYYGTREKVNNVLMNIKPALFVSRVPRTLNELNNWKSSEFRNFLLYWSIPSLCPVLSNEHFIHFCLLARSIFILCKEGITPQELDTADTALLLFVEMFEALYGKKYMTLNLHQLVHLTDCVRHTGPLYVNNCFIFEDFNGFIVKHIHGTQGIDTQLANIVSMLKVPPIMYDRFLKKSDDEEIVSLYHDLSDSVLSRHKFSDEIEEGIRPIGNTYSVTLTGEEAQKARKYGINNPNVKQFQKINMYKRGFYVYSARYGRLQKRQQHIVTCRKRGGLSFYSVEMFVQAEERNPDRLINLVFVRAFEKIKSIGNIWEVKQTLETEFLPIACIINVNNHVVVDGKHYICPSPNRYDRD